MRKILIKNSHLSFKDAISNTDTNQNQIELDRTKFPLK